MSYDNLNPPEGNKVRIENDQLVVPDRPVIPFIEGDGIGPDIWAAAQRVFDAAVSKAYGGSKEIIWFEVFAGQKAFDQFENWLPEDTLNAFREYSVGIKGPLTTPVGGGIRSLNVALRQELDLYVCQRPVRYFQGVQSPVKQPPRTSMPALSFKRDPTTWARSRNFSKIRSRSDSRRCAFLIPWASASNRYPWRVRNASFAPP